MAVYSSTKVINFLLITTGGVIKPYQTGCLFLYKGNQFFANHNITDECLGVRVAVYSSTKVINFLLITTI